MKFISIFHFFLLTFIFNSCQQQATDRLEVEFKDPPSYTKPWVYWYWIDENISQQGISKDLEAMARVGIGKALIGHVSPSSQRGSMAMLSEPWWAMVEHAVAEGGRLGVDIGFFNGPGWSQSGGPWINHEQSMHYVMNQEKEITGPTHFQEKLIYPDSLFRPIALLAFPNPDEPNDSLAYKVESVISTAAVKGAERLFDQDTATMMLFPDDATGNEFTVDVQFAQPIPVHAVQIDFLPVPFYADMILQAMVDGKFETIRKFTLDRRNINFEIGPMRFQPTVFSLPATQSNHFRIIFQHLSKNQGAGLKEIHLLPSPRIDLAIEKQLGKMYSDPLPPWNAYVWANEQLDVKALGIDPTKMMDLTDQLDSTGLLSWEVPEGKWILSLSGMVPTGAKNAPAPPNATGYESDKFSDEATEVHFNSFIGKFLNRVPPEKRTALKTVVIDSYEVGPQNWTMDFRELFMDAHGYDPIPWLPAFSGRIVGNADLSNRFLWDVRRLTSDLIAHRYVRRLRELSNEHGLELWLENYGHWGFPGEFLNYGGQANQVSGEFWYENPYWDLGPLECRAASSAAHIYGKTQVFTEAFTAGFNFLQYPGIMKPRGDQMFCEGINHMVQHVYIHQPWEDRVPGVTAWFGMSYNRHNTWFEQSKAWNDYLRRCHYLLQQGLAVSDICYFIGEDAPKMTGILEPPLPPGYDYDFINAEVIMTKLSVKDGLLVLPDGKSYTLMVLPPLETMRPELLHKIKELLKSGANIYGPPPSHSPSLANYPEADKQVKALANELWGTVDGNSRDRKSVKKGLLFQEILLTDALDQIGIFPDVICEDTTIRWTHRMVDETDIYFLSNQVELGKTISISLRTSGKLPELWQPDLGTIEKVAFFDASDQRTSLSIAMEPYGSVFVLFREPITQSYITSVSINASTSETGDTKHEIPKLSYAPDGTIQLQSGIAANYTLTFNNGSQHSIELNSIPAPWTIEGPWEVRFPNTWDAPSDTVFHQLISWADHPHAGIKYFSGTARYLKTFQLPEASLHSGQHITLNLGEVFAMAEVILNGESLGILWKKPWKLDITEDVTTGKNTLEINVTNTWWNRLVGDAVYPHGFPGSIQNQPRTFTTHKAWNRDSKLLPSGLLGPVTIVVGKVVNL